MTSNKFEIFKPEDFVTAEDIADIANQANKLLKERGQSGYMCIDNTDDSIVCSSVTKVNHPVDTHQALVFLREIDDEPEIYPPLGQRICALPGIDDDLKDILLDLMTGEGCA